MIKLIEMDEKVTLFEQMDSQVAPVILINKFNVKEEQVQEFLEAWADDAKYFKQQSGFISAQLHRGIGGSCVFLNYAIWESSEHLKRAFNTPEVKSRLDRYPSTVVASPHLFKKVAVPGICVD
ncbi:MAG: antibiotic biosynthesis monooxygenase [Thaumarchaeota archaeon]|nr:MAG: antibiotic biosynthesis monooxygenase [Nitrososphaerota archaeon]TLX90397.1 MAG: antibiotic biosynthesis monooxygenase [Nitrososphaerota archaeon]